MAFSWGFLLTSSYISINPFLFIYGLLALASWEADSCLSLTGSFFSLYLLWFFYLAFFCFVIRQISFYMKRWEQHIFTIYRRIIPPQFNRSWVRKQKQQEPKDIVSINCFFTINSLPPSSIRNIKLVPWQHPLLFWIQWIIQKIP